MFRRSNTGQEFEVPRVESADPATWGPEAICGDAFHGLVSHGYKGYFYYTGSDFPAPKGTRVAVARSATELLVHVVADDPELAGMLEYLKRVPTFLDGDHVAVNLLVPSGRRFLFAVNPAGKHYSEVDLTRDAEAAFDAEVGTGEREWQARLRIPFALLGIDDPAGVVMGFDVVRHECAYGMVSTLTRAPTTPPYNHIYDYPVFHFARLRLGGEAPAVAAPGAFADPVAGMTAVLRSPDRVPAGTPCEVVVEVALGRHGMLPGGRLRLRHGAPVLNCGVPWTRPLDWERVQTENPRSAGFLSIEGAPFDIATNGIYTEACYTGDVPLPPGHTLTIRVGDRRHGGPGIRSCIPTTDDHPVIVNADPLARGLFDPLPRWPRLAVVNGPPAALLVSNPGAVPVGARFEVCLRAVDCLGNPAADFEGAVELGVDAAEHSFPLRVMFGPDDRGTRLVEGAVSSRGLFAFTARAGDLWGRGNPIATDGSFGDGYILYGDVHTHTGASDGWRTPEEKMRESRCLRGLQFAAIADHDFDQTPTKWEHYRAVARESDRPGRFVSFLAHEWTPSYGRSRGFAKEKAGHYVILYPGFEGELLRSADPDSRTPRKLFAAARLQGDLMVMPHYHGGRPPVSAEVSYALEIAAWDGKVAETADQAQNDVVSTLNEGYKLGIVAGIDHGGEGLTARHNGEHFSVRAASFDRDAIRDGIKQRRTVALTHTRVLVRFAFDGHEMGSVVTAAAAGPRRFEVRVAAATYPLAVTLVRNGEAVDTLRASGEDYLLEGALTDDNPPSGESWYMLRIVLHGGEPAWSSPIWVG